MELFSKIVTRDGGESPSLLIREEKLSSVEDMKLVLRNNYEAADMFELTRKWRRMDGNGVSGGFFATNLSLSIIFPEDAYVNGSMIIHIIETDMWIYDVIVYCFLTLIISFVAGIFLFLITIALIRCYYTRTGRELPEFLKKFMKPIIRDYRFYVKNKSVLEKDFSTHQVLYSQDKCTICLDSFNEGEKVAWLQSCHHLFHVECVTHWINKKTEKGQLCPVCNVEIQVAKKKKKKPAKKKT